MELLSILLATDISGYGIAAIAAGIAALGAGLAITIIGYFVMIQIMDKYGVIS